jgi:hypothetical protein
VPGSKFCLFRKFGAKVLESSNLFDTCLPQF